MLTEEQREAVRYLRQIAAAPGVDGAEAVRIATALEANSMEVARELADLSSEVMRCKPIDPDLLRTHGERMGLWVENRSLRERLAEARQWGGALWYALHDCVPWIRDGTRPKKAERATLLQAADAALSAPFPADLPGHIPTT